MANKKDEEVELPFKYHTQEFLDVSQEIRSVGHIGRLAKSHIGKLVEYYEAIEYLDEIYSSYFRNPKSISEKLSKIEEKVYDKKYHDMLKQYLETGDTNLFYTLKLYENKLIKRLKLIFKEISSDLVWAELRPKPNHIEQPEESEEPYVIQEVVRGLKDQLHKK